MRLFKKLRRKLSYLPIDDINQIESAFDFAFNAHDGQTRRTGEPYITHPVAVACILADMHLDPQTIMAGLLHDVIEDTEVDKVELAQLFGSDVADLVDGVSKLTQVEGRSLQEYQAENFRKMVLAMARDIRVIIVKLSDRLHNMRTISSMPAHKQRRIAQETLEIYSPIARRLGMRDFSVELEELSFAAMHPMRYKVLVAAIKKVRGKRIQMLNMIQNNLKSALTKADMPSCAIMGREKHIYSIYRKMSNKKRSFHEVMDVYAFRMVVDTVDQCYRVMGLVHRLFKPVPDRFKDYIAIPKVNGYQSLHTTLFGPAGLPIEIQIRTAEMDRMAHSGIAAHWLYKSDDNAMSQPRQRAQEWVEKLLELQNKTGSSLEFIESVKLDLFPEDVYVFTPKGDIMQLPTGACAVDFAFAVHTDIGNACVGVKIDRQISPLSMPLANGQTIEIITSPTGKPNPAWLDVVCTSKARSSLKHYFKNQRSDEAVHLGKEMLDVALAQYGINFTDFDGPLLDNLLLELNTTDKGSLFAGIGMGRSIAAQVARRFSELSSLQKPRQNGLQFDSAKPKLCITGANTDVVKYADCCGPVSGDMIVGEITAGSGMLVHRECCSFINKFRLNPDKIISISWDPDCNKEFIATLVLYILHRPGALAEALISVAQCDSNVEDFSVTSRNSNFYTVKMHILVRDRDHVAQIIRAVRKNKVVRKISREA
jgi:GTP diphosphokinase / guanosine-3',5'-bis(diphosphate) 3'-diphosphatase